MDRFFISVKYIVSSSEGEVHLLVGSLYGVHFILSTAIVRCFTIISHLRLLKCRDPKIIRTTFLVQIVNMCPTFNTVIRNECL